tara:strand:+ start:7484 stop:11575 length:4092 start_codon:yes stop_codon:yes gene_type:complete
MRTYKTCCCCGDKPCKEWDNEYRYNGGGANCPICALGTTTISATDFEEFAPYQPTRNQGDEEWDGRLQESDGHPDNLHYGNLCWHNGEEGWDFYSLGCGEEWNSCWTEYINDESYSFHDKIIPKSTFYQYDSPMGLLPWSPQAFTDWIDNWEGPLLPKGDCTMHCTLGAEGNLGCHKLAFVGAIGKNFGSQNPNTDQFPLCGSDIVTVPPPESDWDEVREWVKSGGKLIVMGESSGSPGAIECKEKIGFFNDSNYYTTKCLDVDDAEPLSGEEVAELLRNFALHCARQDDEEEIEEFFEFRNDEYYDSERDENYINNFEAFAREDGTSPTISCCQRSKRPFLKQDEEVVKSFSFHCSSSSGLLPKGKGEGLVGHCNGEGCTVVWKPNGDGAVVVVYDSNVWGATNSQIPMWWWEQETLHPEIQLDAETLKLRACNSDFWRFMCDDFLDGEMPNYSCTESDSYWDNKAPDNYTSENPCLPTAPCCLPNGECLDDVTVWECFGYEDDNGNRLPGIWWGPEEVHPSGIGSCDLTCADITCDEQDKKLCCSLAEGCSANSLTDPNCCLSEGKGFDGGNLVYKYECCRIAQENGYEPSDVENMWTLSADESDGGNCDACYITGVCCNWPNDGCNNNVRKHLCVKNSGEANFHEDVICEDNENICDPVGACCFEESDECFDELTESDCVSSTGSWRGPDTVCGDGSICEFEVGACCYDEGNCLELTLLACEGSGGYYQGDGVSCQDAECEEPSEGWACCFPYGETCQQCIDTITQQGCDKYEGDWQEGYKCENNPCDTSECEGGACCIGLDAGASPECDNTGEFGCCCVYANSYEECMLKGVGPQDGIATNTFHEGISCDEVDCCGSCCCIDGNQSQCLSSCDMMSNWLCEVYIAGQGQCEGTVVWHSCEDCACGEDCNVDESINCLDFGSCCISECFDKVGKPITCVGQCEDVVSQDDCEDKDENGTKTVYYNQGRLCEDTNCNPGYCCHDDCKDDYCCKDCSFENECLDDLLGISWNEYDCLADDYPDPTCYDTNNSICDPDQTGACCIDVDEFCSPGPCFGNCGDGYTEDDCIKNYSGVFLGVGSVCDTGGFAQYQCVYPKGTCCNQDATSMTACEIQGIPNPCRGCECIGDFWCVEPYCDAVDDGYWLPYIPDNQSCCEYCNFDCDVDIGACCLDNCGHCMEIGLLQCQLLGGDFQGSGTSCSDFCTWRGACCWQQSNDDYIRCTDYLTQAECQNQSDIDDGWMWWPAWRGPCVSCAQVPCMINCCGVYCGDCFVQEFSGEVCLNECAGSDGDWSWYNPDDSTWGQCGDFYWEQKNGCGWSPLVGLTDDDDYDEPSNGERDCRQECIDAGCECNCLNTRNGIVCL